MVEGVKNKYFFFNWKPLIYFPCCDFKHWPVHNTPVW